MALDTLTAALTVGVTWNAELDITGDDYSPVANSGTITKRVSLGTSAANAAAGGSDEMASFIQSVSASSSATIDLTAFTNILQTSSSSFARVKGIVLRLLSSTDDSTNGTAAAYVTIGNNAANDFVSQSGTGWLASATSVIDIPNGGVVAFGVGNAAGVAVDATHKIIKLANGDGSLAAKVQVTLIGGSS